MRSSLVGSEMCIRDSTHTHTHTHTHTTTTTTTVYTQLTHCWCCSGLTCPHKNLTVYMQLSSLLMLQWPYQSGWWSSCSRWASSAVATSSSGDVATGSPRWDFRSLVDVCTPWSVSCVLSSFLLVHCDVPGEIPRTQKLRSSPHPSPAPILHPLRESEI